MEPTHPCLSSNEMMTTQDYVFSTNSAISLARYRESSQDFWSKNILQWLKSTGGENLHLLRFIYFITFLLNLLIAS